jgi:hypothetical protein
VDLLGRGWVFANRTTSYASSPPYPFPQNETDHLTYEVAGWATGSARLERPYKLGGLRSLYFEAFLSQVRIVATGPGVSIPIFLKLNFLELRWGEVRKMSILGRYLSEQASVSELSSSRAVVFTSALELGKDMPYARCVELFLDLCSPHTLT